MLSRMLLAAAVALALCGTALSSQAAAETTVTLSKVHLCCGACVRAVGKVVDGIEGAKAECDQDESTIVIIAEDDKTAQKTVNAIAKAGFHGSSDHKKIKIKDDSGAGKEKAQRVEFAGVHNCCGGCASALEDAVKAVTGVEGSSIKGRQETFVVEGDFVPTEVVKALNDAGFHVKVKKE